MKTRCFCTGSGRLLVEDEHEQEGELRTGLEEENPLEQLGDAFDAAGGLFLLEGEDPPSRGSFGAASVKT